MFPISECKLKEQTQEHTDDINLTTLFKLFTKDINEQDEVKPSTYLKEVNLCLPERLKQLKNISKYHNYFNSSHGGDFFDCFDVDPCILIFQNWEVDKQYMTSITIRNKTIKAKFISLSIEESEIFLISPKQVRKISSHGSLVYKVKFIPIHFINYKMKATINSDGSFYNFEILAIAPRPIINFPDKIDFEKILINFNSMKSFYLTNTGCGVGMAKIYSNSHNVHIEPGYICMNANDLLNLEIKFRPTVLGRVKEKIIIVYSTGEKLFIEIEAFVVNGNIFLNEDELIIKETFITFNELSSLVLYNKTQYSVNFWWHPNKKDEIDSCVTRCYNKSEKISEEASCGSSCNYLNSGSIEEEVFSIMPIEGVLSMNDSFTFLVMFNPIIVGKAESIFYLEVEGLENWLSIKIKGMALGPNINLNTSTLDVNDIYINENYNYQIFAKNLGLVRGTIRSLPLSVTDNFMVITVNFEETVMNPSDISIINISVTTGEVGSFVVELRFEIIESNTILKLILKGTAIEPVIKVNYGCIDFGIIPIGVCFEKHFTIANHSSIDIMLKLQIPLDGVEESIVYDELIRSSVKDLPKTPNEFRLEPTEVKIQAKHRAEVKVFLVANIAKKYSGNIIISSEMHLYENKKLPVCFNAIAPEITCSPDTLRLPYCFKGSEYEQTILISNKGNVQVSFWLLDYKDLQRGIYCHRRDNEMGLIDPLGSAELTFQLSSGSLGEHNFTLLGFVLGNGIVPLCDITIVGIGPVVIVKNESLIWSNINILKPYEKTLSIFNASPIIAEFIISFEKDSNLWMVSIHDGIIDPDETVYVTITPNPIDVGLLKDHLKIQVKDSRILTVKLEAMVTGSSIVFSPNIFPFIDFGPALRIGDNNYKILVSNIGSKAQLVILSIDGAMNIKKIRAQGNPLGKYFVIQPSIFVLPEFSKMDLWVSVKSHCIGPKQEIIHCYTRFGNKYKITYLGSSIMSANFIDLNLIYDPSLLHFDIVSSIHQDPQLATRSFTMHIDWNSPVKVILTIPEPFGIFKDDSILHEETFMVSVDHPLKTDICFDPLHMKDYKIRSYSRPLTLFIVDYNYEKSCTISADVYLPSVSLSPSYINFECVELFQSGQKEVTIKNSTPIAISYRWYWISVLPSRLDKYSLQKSLDMISSTTSFQNNNLCEQTRSNLKIFKSIGSQRFNTFQEFESEARHSGLDVRPVLKEIDSKRISVDEECASFLEFSPFLGELEPEDCVVTIINFTPKYYLCFEAVAVCVIEGGPSEELIIHGCCSPINFEMIPDIISFGFAPCCELCKSMFIIKNNCLKTLPFKIHAPKLSHVDKKTLHQSGVWIEEDSGVVNPFSSIVHKITVWFGTVGEVDINILLEIDNKPKYIKIFGYCCPNQVMISLPRKFPHLIEEYLVLASLREPWFYIPEFITITEDGWEKIILPEMLPSTEDIYLGMERFFLHLSLYHHPSLFSEHFLAKKRAFTIKGFKVPSYFIDFGIVVLGTKAEYKVKILNYYPREVILKVICDDLSGLEELEFQDLRSYFILPPLGTAEFSVSIFATNMFEKSDININYSFNIEVICGPTIPISLSATISQPRLCLPGSVDFGAINCNQMKMLNIPIKNIGIIPCEWIVFIRDSKGHKLDDPKSYIDIPFIVKKSYGYTEPNVSDYIPIYFKPSQKGEYNMILEFIINMNPEKITIPIKGVGLTPIIIMTNVDFGFVIPFSKPIIKTLDVINLSPFSVEVFFPAYDDEIMAEAMVFKAVTRYYKQDIYLPATDNEIIPYNKICNIYRRICNEAIIFETFSRRYNINEYHRVPSFGVRKFRSEIVLKRRYNLDLKECKSLPNLVGKSEIKRELETSLINLCYKKSPELLLEEYFDYLDCGFKPIPPYFIMWRGSIYCSKPEPFISEKFTLIIVLGAPETGHIEWGAKLAKAFGMLSVSLDEIIFQELAESDCIVAEETRAEIRKIYIQEILKDNCFEDASKYPCTNYLQLRSMVEVLMTECPLKIYGSSFARVNIDKIEYSQKLPFSLTVEILKGLIKKRISRYSSNVLIENIKGIFFSDITVALSCMIGLFADKMNFHIINLHSFPLWHLKAVRTLVELETDNNFNAIIEFITFLNGVEHSEILADIPPFIRRYYYLFTVGDTDEGTDDFFPNHPELVWDKHICSSIENKQIISELKSKIPQDQPSPCIKMMHKLCCDIIMSDDRELVWTKRFVSKSKLHSLLMEFMEYARWFSSLIPLWSSMRPKPFKSHKKRSYPDLATESKGVIQRTVSKLLRSFKAKLPKHPYDFDVITGSSLTKWFSRSSEFIKTLIQEPPNDFDVSADLTQTKGYFKSSSSFEIKTQEYANDFDVNTDPIPIRRPSSTSGSFEIKKIQEYPNDFYDKTDPIPTEKLPKPLPVISPKSSVSHKKKNYKTSIHFDVNIKSRDDKQRPVKAFEPFKPKMPEQSVHFVTNTESKESPYKQDKIVSSDTTIPEQPNDFDGITEPLSAKPASKEVRILSSETKLRELSDNFETEKENKSILKCFSQPVIEEPLNRNDKPRKSVLSKKYSTIKSAIMKFRKELIDFNDTMKSRATKVVNEYPELPLWILCAEDLNFDKFIPVLCSQKTAFGIETPKPPPVPKKKTKGMIPEPRLYFHLRSPKNMDHDPRLSHFKIYKEVDEAHLIKIDDNNKSMKEKLSEVLNDKIRESKKSYKMKKMSHCSNLLFSKESQGELSDFDCLARKHLEPGEKASWEVVYSPISCGIISNKLTVRAAGFHNSFTADIRSICDIPTVTFEFNNLYQEMPLISEGHLCHKSGFCANESIYYFQTALISTMKKLKNNIHHQEASFKVSNISSVTAKVSIDFHKKSPEFDVLPKEVEIEPNETAIVTIFSSISDVGSFMEEIFLSTQNNPLPQTIKVQSVGINPLIKFEPRNLTFKNTLLYQEKMSVFQITNLCYKTIYWAIAILDTLSPVIRCNRNSNFLDPYSSEEVSVYFRPEKCYDHKQLYVEVFDAENNELLRYKCYTLDLYATDVKVEINTNLGTQNYLEFGNIKVLNRYVSEVELSKCKTSKQVFYRIRFAAHEQNKVSDSITINFPLEGYIHMKKVYFEVEVFCKDEVHFEKVKAIFVEIYSPFDSNLKIAEIPLIFSFHSHFPKYALYPGDFIDFGNVEIGTIKKLFLTLENIGFVDFNYSFKILKPSSVYLNNAYPSLNLSMVQESSLKNTISLPPLKISKGKGNILPGNQEIYEVVCMPKAAQKIVQGILLTIPELPENSQRISICFRGIAPVLNFDIESLFRELNIFNTRQELSDFPNNGRFVAVFINIEGTLYLRNVSLYQTVNIDIFIENKSQLGCNVSVIVNGEGFSVQPLTLFIKPYLTEIVTLTYSPQQLEVHRGMVKIELDLPYTIENSSFTFLVEGTSELPSISIYDYLSETLIMNAPIRIGFTANKTPVRHLFKVQNSGNVFSQTIIAIEFEKNVTVTLDSVYTQNIIGPDSETDTQSVTLYLQPKETAVFGCTLTPDTIGTYIVILAAHTVLNPYTKEKVKITGDAAIVDISLDGLTFINYFQERKSKGNLSSSIVKISSNYNINFGLCGNDLNKKVIFSICNQSEYTWLFKFSNFDLVSFSPNNGYITPHSSVKIESILDTGEHLPIEKEGTLFLTKMTVVGRISPQTTILWNIDQKKIQLKKSDETVLSAPSNMTMHSARRNQKTVKIVQNIETNTITVQKIDQKINLLAKCWFVETSLFLYHDDETNFRSTVIKQHSEEVLVLENTSEASCHIIFQLEDISFKEIDYKHNLLDNICFVKMPIDTIVSDDPADEIRFFNMNHVFPDNVCLNDVFCPLLIQEMLLAKSITKAKFTFCPPKPGVYSANVRIIMDGKLLDFPRTTLSTIGYIPPVQIALINEVDKDEFKLLSIQSSVKYIKITTYEPKSFIRNKLIYVYNATNCSFSYNWKNKNNVSTIKNSSTGFYCHQVSGNLENQSVLKLEMIFNPQDYGVYQSLWHLEIPDYITEQAFLFIGETKTPDIVFDPDILSLDPVILGMKAKNKIKIHNKEKVAFKYKVDPVSLYSDIEHEKLFIDLPSGVVEPNMTHEVTISSILHVPRKYVYKTFWSFENVEKRWCYKIITHCLNIEVDVRCLIDRNNINETILLKENENNFINIGKVLVNDELFFIFVISNKGKVAINYEWVFSENATKLLDIEINPYEEIVPAHTEFSTSMKVTVLEKNDFTNIPFVLKIFKGPVYTIFFCGSSKDPLYRLSFKEYDFGTQLVQTSDDVYHTVNLRFENLDMQMLLIDLVYLFEDNFKIELPCSSVPPLSTIGIPIHFFPRDKRKYKEEIELYINNTLSDEIVLLGKGESFQVDVVKPSKGIIAFDQIGVNELILEETEIINPTNTMFNINLKVKNEYEGLIEIKLDPTVIELRPNFPFKISVYIKCFSFGDYSGLEVWATCHEHKIRLYSLTIHCVGAKLAFDRKTINFFPHFRKTLHREEVAIINSGNIPTRFKLDTSDLPKMFKIEPLGGECLPRIPYILNIICCLKFITDYLSAKVKCIEEGKDGFLELTLITYPFPPGVQLKTLKFLCPVRQQNIRSISVENRTLKTWSLIPLITGQYFSGEATLEVLPKSIINYTILYKPLTMTKDDKTHKGILVIPTQPKEMVVKLEGRSTEPLLEGTLWSTATAREECVITLSVENPLETLQKMSVQFRKSRSNNDEFNIEGSKCFVLPGRDKKEYIVKFYAYKKGTVNFDVIFTNDENFEYMVYNVTVEISPPEKIWETIEMDAMIDHSLSKTIAVYNPLKIIDTFKVTSLVPRTYEYLTVKPSVLDVHPNQHGEFSIIYSPKKLEKSEVKLQVTGNLLGTYFYRIILRSEIPSSSGLISLFNPFGSKLTFILKLPTPIVKNVPSFNTEIPRKKSYITEHKITTICHTVRIHRRVYNRIIGRTRKLVKEVLLFRAKSDNPAITIKHVDDSSYIEELLCAYEPAAVGTNTASVTVEYFKPYQLFVYKLLCHCEPPQPQGPFDISVLEPFVLKFKNVLDVQKKYSCLCANFECCLQLSKSLFTLEPKEAIRIIITVKDNEEVKQHSAMVRITDLPENLHQWDYCFNVHR